MRLHTTSKEYDDLPELNQLFLTLWKQKKNYPVTKEWDFGQLLELSFAITNDLHFDSPALQTTFNNSLQYDELLFGWEGKEPIEILWFELNQRLRRRILQHIVVYGNR